MHAVDIWTTSRNSSKHKGPYAEPAIIVGYGRKLLRITPQCGIRGYGLTISTMRGRVLLEADMTDRSPPKPEPGIQALEVSARTVFRLFPRKRRKS